LLVERREPLALAGFASGYADQAHFTREFKKRTALTPARYARAFAAPPGAAA
jgi:AraC-like DNA-binding protein